MQLCMNEMTLGRNGTLLSHIEDCRKYGFSCMEVSKGNLFRCLRSGHSTQEIRAAFEKNGVTPACMNAVANITFNDQRGEALLKETAELLFAACRDIGCGQSEIIASFGVGTKNEEEIKEETVRSLQQLSAIAERYGVRLALEYMGLPDSSVQTFDQCLGIIRAAERENVGILLDSWHHYAMGSPTENILKAGGSEIFMVHISDCPQRAPGEALRKESYLPGDGVIALTDMLRILKEIGYSGFVSAEILSPDILNLPVEESFPLVRNRMEKMLRAAGI